MTAQTHITSIKTRARTLRTLAICGVGEHAPIAAALAPRDIVVSHVNPDGAWEFNPEGYDVIIFELVPTSGNELIERLRVRGCCTPLLALSAQNTPPIRIAALDAGADDFLGKPCDFDELEARLRALARRPRAMRNANLACSNVVLHAERRELRINGKSVALGQRELNMIEQLMRNTGRPVAKERLYEKLYGFDQATGSNLIEVSIHRIRKRLQRAGAAVRIVNRRNLGYVLLPAKRGRSVFEFENGLEHKQLAEQLTGNPLFHGEPGG
ncbi:MAG TPA: response regulator transcription factor [Candidatus Sulfotelmatobacter sp.]|nr:response regulator transcription factor [Candidatus Sulfotelmatobacter sp.]